MLKRFTITLILFSWVSPAIADDTGRANGLLVEAVQLIQSADKAASAKERFSLLDKAFGKLNVIIERYPSTDLAVKLITGQTIGIISLDNVGKTRNATEEEAAQEVWEECLAQPTYHCVISQALAAAGKEQSKGNRAIQFALLASVQAEVGDIKGATESIAKALAAIKREEERITLANGFRQDILKIHVVLRWIASAQAEMGDIKAARESIYKALAGREIVKRSRFALPPRFEDQLIAEIASALAKME